MASLPRARPGRTPILLLPMLLVGAAGGHAAAPPLPPYPVDGVPVGTRLNGDPAVPGGEVSHDEIVSTLEGVVEGDLTAPEPDPARAAPAWRGGEDHHDEEFYHHGVSLEPGKGKAGHVRAPDGSMILNTAGDPHPRYPLVALKGKESKDLIRTWPGLRRMLELQQAGRVAESLEVLDETLAQVDAVQRDESGLREGKQCQASRGIRSLAMKMGSPLSLEEEGAIQTATESASRQASPILLDLNGNGVADVTTPDPVNALGPFVRAGATHFDLTGRGTGAPTEWLLPHADGLLARDANGNGRVDSVLELFGDADGFDDGYAKLAMLDADGDGAVAGAELAPLSVWIDDGDGIGEAGELHPVGELGIESLSVRHAGYVSTFVQRGEERTSWDWFPRIAWRTE